MIYNTVLVLVGFIILFSYLHFLLYRINDMYIEECKRANKLVETIDRLDEEIYWIKKKYMRLKNKNK